MYLQTASRLVRSMEPAELHEESPRTHIPKALARAVQAAELVQADDRERSARSRDEPPRDDRA